MATLDNRLAPPPNTPQVSRPPPNPVPSSSPAFATPVHPLQSHPQLEINDPPAAEPAATRPTPVLPILLPPATLRPIAFRTFTKKHNLNLTSPALQLLAAFVGRHCGASWREEGLAELVLEEVAKSWKRLQTNLIVDGGDTLKSILKQLEGSISGGKITSSSKAGQLSRRVSFNRSDSGGSLKRQQSFGISTLEVDDDDDNNGDQAELKNPRSWLKVVDAFEQPRLAYNAARKHFEKCKSTAAFFPPPSNKTELFRQRYQLIHQRILRNESFQTPSVASSGAHQWKITPIANLLGRSGTGHLLLGLITVTPTGALALSDLTGSIQVNLEQATSIDVVQTWLCPGMIVLIDGVYEEEYNHVAGNLGVLGGVGGAIGGRFVGFSIGGPRCETRAMTLGLSDSQNLNELNIGGGFGWVDFLGLGSERAVGSRMRRIEQRMLNNQENRGCVNSNKIVVIGDCNLDSPHTLSALRRILLTYTNRGNGSSANPFLATPPLSGPTVPLAFVLLGNFTTHAAMSSTSTSSYANSSSATSTSAGIPDSIAYKEAFDALALVLSDFPALLRHSTWVFVPGDNDPWPSAFSSGAAAPLPRQGVPEMFTSRLKRAFAVANGDADVAVDQKHESVKGEAIWTSNPSRLSLFGPSCEIILFRDDVSGRMRRNTIPLKQPTTEQDKQHHEEHGPAADISMSGALPSPDGYNDNDIHHINNSTEPVPTAPEGVDTNEEESALAKPQLASVQAAAAAKTTSAQALTKTLLDQSTLSPFPLHVRPLHWDFAASALSLYPLPSVLALCDAEMDPFVLTYQGCVVLNAGSVVAASVSSSSSTAGGASAQWVEFDVKERQGCVREL